MSQNGEGDTQRCQETSFREPTPFLSAARTCSPDRKDTTVGQGHSDTESGHKGGGGAPTAVELGAPRLINK